MQHSPQKIGPLVSIIIPTRNNESVIKACLDSIRKQVYRNIEIIVVDGNSSDATQDIAKGSLTRIITFPKMGDHRSAQRNLGFSEARGDYLMYIDSDMVLQKEVVIACVERFSESSEDENLGALTIHEKSFGLNFWAKCKSMERMCYWGDAQVEGVRFFPSNLIKKIGGFDESLIAAEDWELCERIKSSGFEIDDIEPYILHDEGSIQIWSLWKKKAYYGSHMPQFIKSTSGNTGGRLWYTLSRLYIFRTSLWRQWRRFLSHPFVASGMIVMLTGEIIAGGGGYIYGILRR